MHLSQPTPELAVPDVRRAQEYYRETLGFDIAWYNAEGNIGAVSHGECAIFFRHSDAPPVPQTFWIFSEDVDGTYTALAAKGATTASPPENTPWGMRQFTLTDHLGNTFYVHCDLDKESAP